MKPVSFFVATRCRHTAHHLIGQFLCGRICKVRFKKNKKKSLSARSHDTELFAPKMNEKWQILAVRMGRTCTRHLYRISLSASRFSRKASWGKSPPVFVRSNGCVKSDFEGGTDRRGGKKKQEKKE